MLHTLDFENQDVLYDQIKTISTVQVYAFVFHGERYLTLKRDASYVQFVAQAFLVGRL
jgi:hypothetical protein